MASGNQWNDLFSGLIQGGTNFGLALVDKAEREQAKEDYIRYKGLLTNQLSQNIQQQNQIINPQNEDKTENYGVSTPQDKPFAGIYDNVQQPQSQSNVLGNLLEYQANLEQSKYGKPYSDNLATLYNASIPSYEVKNVGDTAYAFNKKNPRENFVVAENKKLTPQGKEVYFQSTDEQGNPIYIRRQRIWNGQNLENRDEQVSAEEFNDYQKFNAQELQDIKTEGQKNFYNFKYNLGSFGSKKSGNKSGNTALDFTEDQVRDKMLAYLKDQQRYNEIKALHDHKDAKESDKKAFQNYTKTQNDLMAYYGVTWQELNKMTEKMKTMTPKEISSYIKSLEGDFEKPKLTLANINPTDFKNKVTTYIDDVIKRINAGATTRDKAIQEANFTIQQMRAEGLPDQLINMVLEMLKGYGIVLNAR